MPGRTGHLPISALEVIGLGLQVTGTPIHAAFFEVALHHRAERIDHVEVNLVLGFTAIIDPNDAEVIYHPSLRFLLQRKATRHRRTRFQFIYCKLPFCQAACQPLDLRVEWPFA